MYHELIDNKYSSYRDLKKEAELLYKEYLISERLKKKKILRRRRRMSILCLMIRFNVERILGKCEEN